MKNFKLIMMAVLVLVFSSRAAFAEDFFSDISKQITSGISGLKAGDYAGVKTGVTRFVTSTPVLSQSYSMGQIVGSRLSNMYNGLSTSTNVISKSYSMVLTTGGGLSGVNTGLSATSNKSFAEDCLNGLSKQITSGISGLRSGDYAGVKAGVTRFVTSTPVLSHSYSMGQIAGSRLSGIYAGLSTNSNKSFAEDCLNGLSKQITSGISGLRAGDYAGVKAGLTNFVVAAPVLSQSYSLGQIAGSRLSNIYAGRSNPIKINTGPSTSTDLLAKFYGMNQIAGSRLSKVNIDQGTTYTILGTNK